MAHLRDTWRTGMDLHVLRREAVVLRRLLVDNGGDIARLWRAEGRPGQPMIPEVSDLARFPTWSGLVFATADTIDTGTGMLVGEMLLWEDAALTTEIRAIMESDAQPADMPLRKYVEAVCVVSKSRPIRRDDMIMYVANRRGGAHFNRKRQTNNPRRQAAFNVLDEMSSDGWQMNGQDATFAQLITIVHNVVAAPDLQLLSR
ncbi:hypothetical protein [Nocardioides sp. InS609-2]|uniref:hypothetical protein n=1 Tax=Nocardioides sp. InS609-2 TaxID=2760705 RepID=UPI0020C03712|nr:hypothetical protein [Nocardioides sp. InS609-2]